MLSWPALHCFFAACYLATALHLHGNIFRVEQAYVITLPQSSFYSTVPMVLPVHANSLLASLNSRNSLRRLGSGASGVPASEVVTPIFPIKQGVLYSSLNNAETSCWIETCQVKMQEITVWWYLDGYTPLYYVYTRTFDRESYRNRMTCTGRIASSLYTTVSLSEPFSPRL